MSAELSPVDDPLSGPFYAAVAEGRLTVQQCNVCKAMRWPPLPTCPECRAHDSNWVEVTPHGTVWSYVVYHRAFQPSLKDQIPYTVVMVQLDDGPYMIGRLVPADRAPVVGEYVDAELLELDGVPSVQWRLT